MVLDIGSEVCTCINNIQVQFKNKFERKKNDALSLKDFI